MVDQMSKEPRLTGHPISRILCSRSNRTLGFMYEWNNGDRQPAWIGERTRRVRYEPLVADESADARAEVLA